MPDFDKRFSIAHWDNHSNDDDFYRAFAASSAAYKREIRDIYFGVEFTYPYLGQTRRYGETMGVTASPGQIDNLLRIQREFGVECSMTINSLNIPVEIASDPIVLGQFLEFIQGHYDKGLRSCTISNTHLMRKGVLQSRFPEMRWKNTVNHQVKTTQELYDYAALGYNTICLDRSLNRDLETLKEIYKEAKKVNVEISLLVSEGCLPTCPFKAEHDSWQEALQKGPMNYWQTFPETCAAWRTTARMPRLGTDISMATEELVELWMANTDVMKFSGRISPTGGLSGVKMCWTGVGKKKTGVLGAHEMKAEEFEYADSFFEIYEKKLAPYVVDRWQPMGWTRVGVKNQHAPEEVELIWLTNKGKALSKILSTCKNRCWDCHACERVFGVAPFDSVIGL